MSVFDAYGKPGSGITTGNLMWWGDFDLCQSTEAYNSTERIFEGEYCLTKIKNLVSPDLQCIDIYSGNVRKFNVNVIDWFIQCKIIALSTCSIS